MSGMNRLQRGALSATTSVLAHAGPRLMQIKPVRRTITNQKRARSGCFWLASHLKQRSSPLPAIDQQPGQGQEHQSERPEA